MFSEDISLYDGDGRNIGRCLAGAYIMAQTQVAYVQAGVTVDTFWPKERTFREGEWLPRWIQSRIVCLIKFLS